MAKLSAHGSEVARLRRNFPRPKDSDFASEDVYLSLRTDGFVLMRRALNWRDGKRNLRPWRIHSKIKAATGEERRERIPAIFPKLIRNLTGKGYVLHEGPGVHRGAGSPGAARRRRDAGGGLTPALCIGSPVRLMAGGLSLPS